MGYYAELDFRREREYFNEMAYGDREKAYKRRGRDATVVNGLRRIKEIVDAMPEGPKKVAAVAAIGTLLMIILEGCGVTHVHDWINGGGW